MAGQATQPTAMQDTADVFMQQRPDIRQMSAQSNLMNMHGHQVHLASVSVSIWARINSTRHALYLQLGVQVTNGGILGAGDS